MTDSMTPSETVENEVNDLLQKKDFGMPLKLAREKSGLSPTEVAQNLLISVDIIKALENSQADALPALTFTQGYIRSYARLLGVSADEIIDDYAKMAPNSKQVLTPHSVLPAQKCCNDKVIKVITVGFVIGAIIVLAYWLVNTDFKIPVNTSAEVAAFNTQTVDESLSENAVNNEPFTQQTINLPEVLPATTVNVEKSATDDDSLKPNKNESVQNKNIQADIASIENTDTPVAAPAAEDTLFLSALGDSWCEIQDSTGKRLYYQLLNTGDEIELSGVAPFIVFLGNAPKIRVEVNNKIVDFESLINNSSNIASLKISKDAAVIPFSNH